LIYLLFFSSLLQLWMLAFISTYFMICF
jgi:hypothetical protein